MPFLKRMRRSNSFCGVVNNHQSMPGWLSIVLWVVMLRPSCFSTSFGFTGIIFTTLAYATVCFTLMVKVFTLTENCVCSFLVFHVITNLKLSPVKL